MDAWWEQRKRTLGHPKWPANGHLPKRWWRDEIKANGGIGRNLVVELCPDRPQGMIPPFHPERIRRRLPPSLTHYRRIAFLEDIVCELHRFDH